jgi:exopolyphosphatase / guanosine-5'-triphosphate,3'-diphosphate pyrophosphatase
MMIAAVLDFGTNIFTIKIVNLAKNGRYQVLHKESRFVKLAEDGIEKIGPAPYARALDIAYDYASLMSVHRVEKYKAIGTAALRTASNGPALMEAIEDRSGIVITMISGDEEARLIHLGVEENVPFGNQKMLIMDIGGGSVEFIIANAKQVFWAQSFLVGIAILRRQFHRSEPILDEEIQNIRNFLAEELQPLKAALQVHHIDALVGTSGTFDILSNNYPFKKGKGDSVMVKSNAVEPFLRLVLDKTKEERDQMTNLFPPTRSDMLVVGMLLIQFVLDLCGVEHFWVTNFDIKEGILREMVE